MKLELLDLAMGDFDRRLPLLRIAGSRPRHLFSGYSILGHRFPQNLRRHPSQGSQKPPSRPVQALSIRHLLHLGIGNRPRAIHRGLPEKSILDPATSQECLMAASREMQSG